MSAFVLKIIALISMTFDHLSYLIFGNFSFFNLIGRLAFPIFAYQITEGYIHTSNLKKYFLRLLVFAIISQVPFMLFLSIFTTPTNLNIFFTLLLGLTSITVFDKLTSIPCKNKFYHYLLTFLGLMFTLLLALFANLIHSDYKHFGVLIIFSFYIFRNNKILMNLSFIALVFLYFGKHLFFSSASKIYLMIIIFTIFPIILINFYNHKKGINTKYLLYLFYPLHLLIIYALSLIL